MKKKYSLRFVLALVFSASVLSCVILSLLFYWNTRAIIDRADGTKDFAELFDVISTRFIGTVDIDEVSLAAKRAAVDSLDDRWSYFMTPDEYTVFMQTSDNRYSGIGVEVKIDEETEGIEVLGVYRDSGAWEAGIIIGDIITAVDGESITGFTLIDVRAVLKRPLGETVRLTVLRNDGLYYELTVTYNLVFVDPVAYEMLSGNIGYVSIRNFDTGAADGFITAVNDLIEQGAAAFIYDVRSNNGGKVTEMTRILDFLLPEGVIFISVSRSGNEQIIMSDAASLDKPAVVLVNVHSYSGAEYFAAILSEYEYAHTVGEQTTGKNRMQTTIRLSSGSAVHLSTGEYLTKNRVSLFETDGFTPEYLISLTDEEYALFRDGVLDEATDPQLAKAISLLMD